MEVVKGHEYFRNLIWEWKVFGLGFIGNQYDILVLEPLSKKHRVLYRLTRSKPPQVHHNKTKIYAQIYAQDCAHLP